jgi:hypothetical protein
MRRTVQLLMDKRGEAFQGRLIAGILRLQQVRDLII